MRNMMSYAIALVIIVIAALWLGTGTLVEGGRGPGNGETPIISFIDGGDGPLSDTIESAGLTPAEEEAGEEDVDPVLTIAERNAESGSAENLRSVRIKHFSARAMPILIPLRGATEASATTSASAETSGIVKQVHVTKGEEVAEGDRLCTLDQGTRQASLAQAQATLEQAQVAFESNRALIAKGLAAENSAKTAEANLRAAEAARDQAQAELDRTEIVAETSGLVQEPVANVGDLLGVGAACATIVRLDPIVFVGSIPEAQIALARTGLPVHLTTISGQEADGEITYIASTADTSTRTFKVEADIPNADGSIRDGLSAQAEVNGGVMPAQLIPQSVLTLDDDGLLGVKAVDDGMVVFHEVTILRDTRDGVWVSGLPDEIDVITLGQESVQPGQRVDAAPAEESAAS